MANVLIKEETMTAIGEAIRAKTGKTELILSVNMPAEIEGIQSGGNDDILKGIIERTATEITLPSDITVIGDYAFYTYINLALISLPEGLTSIGDSAFGCCIDLALTSLPEGLTSIGDYAFYDCTNLTEITFKGTPTKIGSSAFGSCTNLLTINVPWAVGAVANAPWGATNATINYNYTEG